MTETHILVASDADAHWRCISKGIRAEVPDACVVRVKDGSQAIRLLFEVGLLTDRPLAADLIVLDGALPGNSAAEILRRVREHGPSRRTPTLFLRHSAGFSLDWLTSDRWTTVLDITTSRQLERSIAAAIRRLNGSRAGG